MPLLFSMSDIEKADSSQLEIFLKILKNEIYSLYSIKDIIEKKLGVLNEKTQTF